MFYELGIAHSVGNKTIMTCQKNEEVPFDIASYRVILYEQSISGSKKLEQALDKAVKELLASLDQTNNPVQEVFGSRSVGGIKRKAPIAQVVDFGSLSKGLRDMIALEEIRFVDDLRTLDLEEIKTRYKFGQGQLSKLIKIILENEAYNDLDQIQRFALKHRLNTTAQRSYSPWRS